MSADDWRGALLAEFAEADALVRAVREVRAAGYRRIDAFTPLGVLSEYSWMRSGCCAGQCAVIGKAERSLMPCSAPNLP